MSATGPWLKNLKGRSAVVIGGGVAGLCCAAALAVRGAKATLLERHETVGGKLETIRRGPYRFDPGPTAVVSPQVFTRLFSNAELRFSDFVDLRPVDPLYRAVFADGEKLDVWSEPHRFREEIARLSVRDAARFPRFLKECEAVREALERGRTSRGGTLAAFLRAHFTDPRVLRLLGRYATFGGVSPQRGAATLAAIAANDWKHLLWYPAGGMETMRHAFVRLAELSGVAIETGCAVERIEIEAGRARRVSGQGFRTLDADIVVIAGDARAALRTLLEDAPAAAPLRAEAEKARPGFSSFVWCAGVDSTYAEFERHHTVFFGSLDPREEFRQLEDWGVPAARPTVTVANPAASGEAVAPEGHLALTIHTVQPAVTLRHTWSDAAVELERERIARRLEGAGVKDFALHVVEGETRAPAWYRTHFRTAHGSTHGVAAVAGAKPLPNRVAAVKGLYLAGDSVNPGAGLATVATSAMLAAHAAAEDFKG